MADSTDVNHIVDFLFETGILSKTPRSGFHFLGSGQQSVAEHINRVVFIGYVLSRLEPNVDRTKVIEMCLFHDLPEARTSDLNYVHQKYAETKPDAVIRDLEKNLPFGRDIKETINEYEARQTKESQLAKDADQLEWILSLKEQLDIGNNRAGMKIPSALKRLQTDVAKQLAEKIVTTDSDHWWFSDKDDEWWVNRNRKLEL